MGNIHTETSITSLFVYFKLIASVLQKVFAGFCRKNAQKKERKHTKISKYIFYVSGLLKITSTCLDKRKWVGEAGKSRDAVHHLLILNLGDA